MFVWLEYKSCGRIIKVLQPKPPHRIFDDIVICTQVRILVQVEHLSTFEGGVNTDSGEISAQPSVRAL